MKSVHSLWLAGALLGSLVCAPGAPPSPGLVRIAGQEYVRLADWAKAHDFDLHWLRTDETVQLNSHSARLLFTVDSCEARVNGIAVWLLFPLVDRGGTAYIAQQDLQATLRPLLFRPKNAHRPPTIKSVCLDPGHGGKDPGFCVRTKEEKKYTLLLAQELRRQLARAGLKTSLTRTADSTLELPARPELARLSKADVFVSLHFNATEAGHNSVQGTEVYCLTPAGAPSTNARGEAGSTASCVGNQFNDQNLVLAYQIQKSLAQNLEAEDRGVRRARWAVLREAVMPAVLIEAGFMSHPAEGRKIQDAGYRRQIAGAIVQGLLAYKRQVEQPDEVTTAKR